MKFFYIAEIPSITGKKEIHIQDCPNIPDMLNRKYLGPYNSHHEVMRRIHRDEPNAECCPICCTSISIKSAV